MVKAVAQRSRCADLFHSHPHSQVATGKGREATSAKTASSCPACGVVGEPVKPVTLRSLLQPHLPQQVRDEVYHFCASPECQLPTVQGAREGVPALLNFEVTSTQQADVQALLPGLRDLIRRNDLILVQEAKA